MSHSISLTNSVRAILDDENNISLNLRLKTNLTMEELHNHARHELRNKAPKNNKAEFEIS
jgi:hypothetical protein